MKILPLFLFLYFLWTIVFLSIPLQLKAQGHVQLEYSSTQLKQGQVFKISLSLSEEKLKSISNFPEIEDFTKGKTYFIKGKKVYVVEQDYIPLKSGEFTLRPFYLMINNQKYSFKEQVLTVQAPRNKSNFSYKLPEASNSTMADIPDAFFSVISGSDHVYCGEGFWLNAAFYIAKENSSEFNFVDLRTQVRNMVHHIKPVNCWIDEPALTNELQTDTTEINGKSYLRYTLYSAFFFPLDTIDIHIPETSLKLIVYKTTRKSLLIERKAYFYKFHSKAIEVKVKSMPPHPMKDKLPVGQFSLEERISTGAKKTGEMFKYFFIIKSKTNNGQAGYPLISESNALDIFPPRVNMKSIQAKKEQAYYEKIYEYPVTPKVDGEIYMRDHFSWIFFNPKSGKYDTLLPHAHINVAKNSSESESQVTVHRSFYESMIPQVSNKIIVKQNDSIIQWASNIIIVLMLLSTIILILKK